MQNLLQAVVQGAALWVKRELHAVVEEINAKTPELKSSIQCVVQAVFILSKPGLNI